jgi:hypothetical protein
MRLVTVMLYSHPILSAKNLISTIMNPDAGGLG